MPQILETSTSEFVDRRNSDRNTSQLGHERRQFANSYNEFSPEASELAQAIDAYKLHHRRRFITYEEMIQVIQTLGYHR